MQTKRREALITGVRDRKLLSIDCLPGHQVPGTPPQLGAAERNRIGLPVRRASASPSFRRVNHWIPPAAGASPAAGAGMGAARTRFASAEAINAAVAAANNPKRVRVIGPLLKPLPVRRRSL